MKSLQPYEDDGEKDACFEITFTVILKDEPSSFWGNQRNEWSFELWLVYGGRCTQCALTPASSSRHLSSLSLLYFQIHIIDFDDENNIINKNVLLHQAGEIWHIGASPADKAVLTTCYNKSESYCFLLSLAPLSASLFIMFLFFFLLFIFLCLFFAYTLSFPFSTYNISSI